MALSNVIPEVWRKMVLASLRKSLPAQEVCNLNFREEVWGMGDTLHILSLGNLADAAYGAGNITYTDPTDSTTDLLIDQAQYVAFKDEDAVKAKTNVNYLSELLTDAGYQLADFWDTTVMGEYANAGINNYATGTTPWQFTATTCANVPAFFASIVRDLKEANAPAGEIFLIAPPTVEEAVNIYFGGKLAPQDGGNVSGFKGNFFGVDMYVSNNVQTDTNLRALAGVKGRSIALAQDIITDEGIRLEGRMATGYRMLSIGGVKTYRPAISVDVNINTTPIATS